MANQKNVTRKGVRAMMHPKPGRDPRVEGRPRQDASADYDYASLERRILTGYASDGRPSLYNKPRTGRLSGWGAPPFWEVD